MSLLARLGQGRIVGEVRFALGGALAGATAGLVIGFLSPTAHPLVEGGSLFTLVVSTSRGVGLGWWGGLAWSVLFAVHARRTSPPPPVSALPRGAWVAAAVVVLGTLTAHLLDAGVSRGVIGGVLGGTIAARLVVARTGRAPTP
jgi:hypothetical protein